MEGSSMYGHARIRGYPRAPAPQPFGADAPSLIWHLYYGGQGGLCEMNYVGNLRNTTCKRSWKKLCKVSLLWKFDDGPAVPASCNSSYLFCQLFSYLVRYLHFEALPALTSLYRQGGRLFLLAVSSLEWSYHS